MGDAMIELKGEKVHSINCDVADGEMRCKLALKKMRSRPSEEFSEIYIEEERGSNLYCTTKTMGVGTEEKEKKLRCYAEFPR